MSELEYKPVDRDSIWFTRRVGKRSKEKMLFLDELPYVAESAEVPFGFDYRRISSDAINRAEGMGIATENPDMRINKLLSVLTGCRNKSREYQLGNYLSIGLGRVVAYEISDTEGYVGAQITDVVVMNRDRHDLSFVISDAGDRKLHLPTLKNFYVDYLTYDPRDSQGIGTVVDYLNRFELNETDLFEVNLMDPRLVADKTRAE